MKGDKLDGVCKGHHNRLSKTENSMTHEKNDAMQLMVNFIGRCEQIDTLRVLTTPPPAAPILVTQTPVVAQLFYKASQQHNCFSRNVMPVCGSVSLLTWPVHFARLITHRW